MTSVALLVHHQVKRESHIWILPEISAVHPLTEAANSHCRYPGLESTGVVHPPRGDHDLQSDDQTADVRTRGPKPRLGPACSLAVPAASATARLDTEKSTPRWCLEDR